MQKPDMTPTITYAVLTHNEPEALTLLDSIQAFKGKEDRVVVLDDSSGTEYVTKLLAYPDTKVVHHKLKHSYSSHRNYITDYLKTDYTVWLDADESLTPYLQQNLKRILQLYKPDLIWLPRANTFGTNTQVAWPDYQGRVVKNGLGLVWHKNLHEQIQVKPDTNQLVLCPTLDYALNHTKPLDQVIATNQKYASQYTANENKGVA